MPKPLARPASATWKTVNADRQHLVDAKGAVIAEVFRRRFSPGWGYSFTRNLQKLSGFAGTLEEAKKKAEAQ